MKPDAETAWDDDGSFEAIMSRQYPDTDEIGYSLQQHKDVWDLQHNDGVS